MKRVSFKASFSNLPKFKIETKQDKERFEAILESNERLVKGLWGFSTNYDFQLSRLKELEDVQADNVKVDTAERLREAVFCYVNGQFLACIATSGIIAEEIALDLIEENLPEKERKLLDVTGAKHDRRLNVLAELKIISNDTNSWFREVQKLRNRYVHASSETIDKNRMKRDAKSCLNNLMKIITRK